MLLRLVRRRYLSALGAGGFNGITFDRATRIANFSQRINGRSNNSAVRFESRRSDLRLREEKLATTSFRYSPAMNEIHVHCCTEESTMELSLMAGGKIRTLNRGMQDEMATTLTRIALTIAKKSRGSKSRTGESGSRPPPPPTEKAVLVNTDGSFLDPAGLTNAIGWERLCGAGGVQLRIPSNDASEDHRLIVYNPPVVTSITCTTRGVPMVGYPLQAICETKFATSVEWQWVKGDGPVEGSEEEQNGISGTDTTNTCSSNTKNTAPVMPGVIVSQSAVYTPTESDSGYNLRVRATPVDDLGRRGRPCAHFMPLPVSRGELPELLMFRGEREPIQWPALRVITWNILADRYCTSPYADKVLYSYCDRKWREQGYRTQVVLRELLGYSGDIICLQECDRKIFDQTLLPMLQAQGFSGTYRQKGGTVSEGGASFFRTSKLELISTHDFDFKEVISAAKSGPFVGLWKACPQLLSILTTKLTTVAQISVLRIKGHSEQQTSSLGAGSDGRDRILIVANTHLFFHPNAAHIRLIQMEALMSRVITIKEELAAQGHTVSVIVCGDMNSQPHSAIRYMEGDTIGPDFNCWNDLIQFKWGDKFFSESAEAAGEVDESEASMVTDAGTASAASASSAGKEDDVIRLSPEEIKAAIPVVQLSLPMVNCGGNPPFTNFTPGFTDTLDYIFGDAETIEPISHAPYPDESVLRSSTPGIPNKGYPSDHIAIVGTVRLR